MILQKVTDTPVQTQPTRGVCLLRGESAQANADKPKVAAFRKWVLAEDRGQGQN